MVQLRRVVWWICQRYRLEPYRGDAMPAPKATITLRPDGAVRLRVVPR